MAYQFNYLDDEKNKAAAEGAQRSTSGVVGGTLDAPAAGEGPGGGPAMQKPANASAPTSGFVNLDTYLNANKGKGGQMASAATADLSGQVKKFNEDATKSGKTNFMASAGTEDLTKLKSNLRSNAAGTKEEAQAYLGATYGGPTAQSVAEQHNLGRATDLSKTLQGVDDAANQKTLLTDTYGKNGPYTGGFANLDQFLVAGDQSGRDVIQGVKAQGGEVQKTYDNTLQGLGFAEGAAKQKFSQNRDALRADARAALGEREAKARSGMETMNAGLNSQNRGISNASLSDALSGGDLADLEALAALSGQQSNADWYKPKTYNAGTAPVAVPDYRAVAAGLKQGAPNTDGTVGYVDEDGNFHEAESEY